MIEFTGTATLSDAVDEFARRRGHPAATAMLDTPAASSTLWTWMLATATLHATTAAHDALGNAGRMEVASMRVTTTDTTLTVRFKAGARG